ncbi:MAG: hypothetical protein MUP70_01115 [Candidatus Aminicenantes bacterium]|nr:hypothetical protein [Candidatus Aminicenantes bacterium]
MNSKNKLWIPFFLLLFAASFSSCKRLGITEPDAFGPSTFAMLLNVSLSPNVIFAGLSRESTTIRIDVKKYDGTPVSGQRVNVQIRNAAGERMAVGFFEGNQTAVTKTTNDDGDISLKYYGPLAGELVGDSQLYVHAIIDWQGTDYISEYAPLMIIRNTIEVQFEIIADPNVLYCTADRPQSLIKGIFKLTDGRPLVNRRVYFYVMSGPGEFDDGKRTTYAMTDSSGIARIYYIGPTEGEIAYDQFVQLRGQPETSTPDYIHYEIAVRLIKGQK